MIRLSYFELSKIWRKPSFLFSMALLLMVNLFLLWYINLPDGRTPPLSANKSLGQDLIKKSEGEKSQYIKEMKEKLDGLSHVRDILNMQGLAGEMGSLLAEEEMGKRPGLFDQYYDLYQKDDYLIYTETLEEEMTLIQEAFEEESKVAGYEEYLESVQNNRQRLNNISIFSKKKEKTFSSRNVEKSAADYGLLNSTGLSWLPSKGIKSAMENIWTDIFIILGLFLFVGTLITEEKEKGLFYITRASRYGLVANISAKLAALLVHCLLVTSLIYGSNLIFFAGTIGLGDLTAKLQSLAPYMESSLDIQIISYIILSILTKGLVLFLFGSFLTAISIFSKRAFMPYLCGVGVMALSGLLYSLIPAHSAWNLVKYLNPMGLLRTEDIYGTYLNLNLFGYPLSQLLLSWITISILIIIGLALSILGFVRTDSLEIRRVGFTLPIAFSPHDNLFFHEAYKILISNRSLVVLLFFSLLISRQNLLRKYEPSVQEQYYQSIMLELEGEMTEEKEDIIRAEQERYERAFSQIEVVDRMVEEGEIDEDTGEDMKQRFYGVVNFYPEFEKVLLQYEKIHDGGGRFIYDTGYLYLFGILDKSFMMDLLLILLGLIFGLANVISMEYEENSWYFLSATKIGKRKIIWTKIALSLLCAGILLILPWIFKSIAISSVYPMNELGSSIQAIPYYQNFSLWLPIWAFIAGTITLHFLLIGTITLLILLVSGWRKNHLQSLFFSLFLFVVPLVLKIVGT